MELALIGRASGYEQAAGRILGQQGDHGLLTPQLLSAGAIETVDLLTPSGVVDINDPMATPGKPGEHG